MKSVSLQRPFRLPNPTAAWWALMVVYYVSCCLQHLRFTLWLLRQRDTFVGRMAFGDMVPAFLIAGAAALFLWVVIFVRRSRRPRLTAVYWVVWLLAVVAIDRYLTYSIYEYAHYPQYALLAWLVARVLDPQRTRWYVGRVLFWTTLLGAGDELLQYLWITTSYSEYLDFNDFLTNLVAAAAGALLYYGSAGPSDDAIKRSKPVVATGAAIALTLVVATGLLTGRIVQTPAEKVPPGGFVRHSDGGHSLYLQRGPDFYGAWQPSRRHERYYVLSPVSGLLIMLAAGLTFAGYGRSSHGCLAASRAKAAAAAAWKISPRLPRWPSACPGRPALR